MAPSAAQTWTMKLMILLRFRPLRWQLPSRQIHAEHSQDRKDFSEEGNAVSPTQIEIYSQFGNKENSGKEGKIGNIEVPHVAGESVIANLDIPNRSNLARMPNA